jgi:PAS domain S-box-containing protein
MPDILLVDDEQNLLDIGKIYLKKNTGFTVETLTSAQDALLFLASHQVDVIVSDYQMPEMDGIEFLKAVRARGDETPFIIFTGKGREEVVIEALNSGADFYLQKGGEPKSQFVELAHKIQYAVSRRQDEGALVYKEAELQAILQGSPVPTFAIDRTHHVVSWNRALEEITGIRAADILGTTRHWQAFYDKERPCLADLLIDGKIGAIRDWYRGKCKKNVLIHDVYEATDFFPRLGKSGRWLHFTACLIESEGRQRIGAVETLQDITGHMEAEEALRKSEERYRSVVEDQTEFICRFTPDGRLTFVNDAYCRYFNLDKNQCLMKHHSVVLPPEDALLMKQHLASLTPDNPVALIEHRIIMQSGEVRWQRWNDRAIFDKNGHVVEYQSVGRDVTNRIRAEELLKESEFRFRELFNSMRSGVAVYRAVDDGADFIIVDFNCGAEIIEKIPKQDVIGRRVSKMFPGVYEFGIMDVFRRVWQTGISEHHPLSIYNDEHIVSWRENFVYRLPSGEIVAIYDDITERKRAEEALRESEKHYRTLMEQVPELVLVQRDGIIQYTNPAALKTFGHRVEEVVNRPVTDFIAPEYHDTITTALCRRMSGEKVEPYEVEILGGTGGRRAVVVSGTRIEFKGAPASLIVLTDITERKALEEAVQQANRKLNLLSSITRHDIQNQLLALRGYIEISREYLDNKKLLMEFFEKEENVAKTIEEQIRFTKEYQEVGVKEPVWQNVHDSINKAVIGVHMRDIRIEVDSTDLEIFADPLFDKVFYNLIDNALRYGDEGMTAIHVSSHESDEGLILICEDDGVGISEDDKKSLFSRGFGKHTGLGLFLVREILSITGITITEDGTPGNGARFEINVPKGLYRFTDIVTQ